MSTKTTGKQIGTGRRSKRNASPGFTLIEMVVATFLLAIGILGVMSAIEASLQSTGLIEQAQIASQLAQRKMTDLEINSDTLAQTSSQQGDYGADFPGFTWATAIEPTEFKALYQVTVTVEWGKGRSRHSRTLVTYLRDTSSAGQGTSNSSGPTASSGAGNAAH